ncbi:hypothetical protein MP638_000743 [Amoeboaphelidium occidentale]|nr:hypothetical protein MP638_000743 [Amoeboaphelidium occidentale]
MDTGHKLNTQGDAHINEPKSVVQLNPIKYDDQPTIPKNKVACAVCKRKHIACTGGRPCDACIRRGLPPEQCVDAARKKLGRPLKNNQTMTTSQARTQHRYSVSSHNISIASGASFGPSKRRASDPSTDSQRRRSDSLRLPDHAMTTVATSSGTQPYLISPPFNSRSPYGYHSSLYPGYAFQGSLNVSASNPHVDQIINDSLRRNNSLQPPGTMPYPILNTSGNFSYQQNMLPMPQYISASGSNLNNHSLQNWSLRSQGALTHPNYVVPKQEGPIVLPPLKLKDKTNDDQGGSQTADKLP